MKKIMMVLALSVVCLSACEKGNRENIIFTNKNNTSGSSSMPSDRTPANSLNPYDDIGALHNRIMDYIEEHRPANTKDRRKSVELIHQFCTEQGLEVPDEGFYESARQTVAWAQADIHNLVIAKTPYSRPVKDALDSMLFLLERLADQDHYPYVKAAIVNFESAILKSGLSEEERSIILQTASVARFSVYYWMNRESVSVKTSFTTTSIKGIVRWFAGAINDVGGFITSLKSSYAAECSDDARETVDYTMPNI